MSIDMMSVREAIDTRLPRRVQWWIGEMPLDFDFSPEQNNLRQPEDSDVVGGPIPDVWRAFRLFGRCNYGEGGGASPWIAINERDGSVCGLDIERQGNTILVFNSSLDRFIRTFALLDPYLCAGQKPPAEFASRIESLDPEVYASSEWRDLIEFITAP